MKPISYYQFQELKRQIAHVVTFQALAWLRSGTNPVADAEVITASLQDPITQTLIDQVSSWDDVQNFYIDRLFTLAENMQHGEALADRLVAGKQFDNAHLADEYRKTAVAVACGFWDSEQTPEQLIQEYATSATKEFMVDGVEAALKVGTAVRDIILARIPDTPAANLSWHQVLFERLGASDDLQRAYTAVTSDFDAPAFSWFPDDKLHRKHNVKGAMGRFKDAHNSVWHGYISAVSVFARLFDHNAKAIQADKLGDAYEALLTKPLHHYAMDRDGQYKHDGANATQTQRRHAESARDSARLYRKQAEENVDLGERVTALEQAIEQFVSIRDNNARIMAHKASKKRTSKKVDQKELAEEPVTAVSSFDLTEGHTTFDAFDLRKKLKGRKGYAVIDEGPVIELDRFYEWLTAILQDDVGKACKPLNSGRKGVSYHWDYAAYLGPREGVVKRVPAPSLKYGQHYEDVKVGDTVAAFEAKVGATRYSTMFAQPSEYDPDLAIHQIIMNHPPTP